MGLLAGLLGGILLLPSPAEASRTITVEGRLFYNDLRNIGHFDYRRTMSGAVGQQVGFSAGATNYLGAWYVVADFYEVDTVPNSILHPNCHSQTLLGSRTINYRGEYSFTATIDDDNCNADGNVYPDIAVKFRLRFCNASSRCYSVEDGNNDTYELWHSAASPSNPAEMSIGTRVLADAAFEAAPYDVNAMAANHYAGLVEATDIWHVQEGVPFYYSDFGEVFIEFPSASFTSAKTTGNSRMHFPMPAQWPAGGYHEFGHILHARAWEGTTRSCGNCPGGVYDRNGDPDWNGTEQEYDHTALKEGWASFVGVATQYYPDGCGSSWSDNTSQRICSADPTEYPQTAAYVTHPNAGKSYPRNVAKMLCAWTDEINDNDPNMAGYGDIFHATLYSTWSNMENLRDWANGAAGLHACDYVDYYLNERKSVANVGAAAHDDYVEWITNLIYNAGISCGYPAPSGT